MLGFLIHEVLFQLNLHQAVEMLSITVLLEGLRIDDRTPYYSELYPERMVLCSGPGVLPSQAEIKIVK